MDNDKYLFRRQFILGIHYVDSLEKWNKVSVTDGFCLTAHPDLEVTRVAFKDNTIVILGYILDPFNPSLNNQEIVEKISEGISAPDDIFGQLETMCGRFAIIAKINRKIYAHISHICFFHAV